MHISSDKAFTPLHEKLKLCKYCGRKLTLLDQYRKKMYGKVVCSQCGNVLYGDKYIKY